MRHWFLTFLVAAWPFAASAQDWATAEVCEISTDPVADWVFDPPGLTALEASASDVENGLGRFWRVTHPNGGVSHLWGTWHSADPMIVKLPDAVEQSIAASRVVAVEVDFVAKSREALRFNNDDPNRFREPSDAFEFADASDGSIAGLTLELSDWVRARAIELGWTEDVDLILSPAGMAEMLLSDPCEDFYAGVLPLQDDYIQLVGRLNGARVLGLEPPSQFLADLAEMPPETAEAIIAVYASYQKPTSSNNERSAAFQLYQQGRLGVLAAWDAAYVTQVLGEEGARALRLTDDYLLTFRNERFLQRLERQLSDADVFVAIGAAHLPGPDGLVAMLRNRGYSVTRVTLPGELE